MVPEERIYTCYLLKGLILFSEWNIFFWLFGIMKCLAYHKTLRCVIWEKIAVVFQGKLLYKAAVLDLGHCVQLIEMESGG